MLDRLIEFHTQGSADALVLNLPTTSLTSGVAVAILRAKLGISPNRVLTEPDSTYTPGVDDCPIHGYRHTDGGACPTR